MSATRAHLRATPVAAHSPKEQATPKVGRTSTHTTRTSKALWVTHLRARGHDTNRSSTDCSVTKQCHRWFQKPGVTRQGPTERLGDAHDAASFDAHRRPTCDDAFSNAHRRRASACAPHKAAPVGGNTPPPCSKLHFVRELPERRNQTRPWHTVFMLAAESHDA